MGIAEGLIAGLAGLAVFAALWGPLGQRLPRPPSPARLKAALAGRGGEANRPRRRRLAPLAVMRQVVEALRLTRNREARRISERLARAGWRSANALATYLFLKLLLPLAGGLLAVTVFYVFGAFELTPLWRLAAALGLVLAGAYLPDILVRNAIDKRRDRIRKALPNTLDLMVICAEAGLSLDATFQRVTREMATAAPDISDEYNVTGIELRFLAERRQALDNLARRTDLAGVQALVNTLQQTERFGTPLSQALRVLSSEMRNERMMRAEEKAARLPAIMTVPLIVFILPALFVVLMGPALLNVLDAFR